MLNSLQVIRALLEAVPFEPFMIHMSNNRYLHVEHPDFLTITARGTVIWENNTDDMYIVSVRHIAGVEKKVVTSE